MPLSAEAKARKAAYVRRWREENPGVAAVQAKRWRQENPRKRKDGQLRWSYNLTLVAYEALLAAQDGACASCGVLPAPGIYLAVDHDHHCCPGSRSCGRCIRGLLCALCNREMGVIESARYKGHLDYLERWQCRPAS